MQAVRVIDFPYHANAESLFARLRTMPDAIWLDSGKPASLYGRFDIISAAPDAILETYQGITTRSDLDGKTSSSSDPFIAAAELINELQPVDESLKGFPFTGGIMGYWGYGLRWPQAPFDQLKSTKDPATTLPDMRIGRYLWSLVMNHSTRKGYIFAHQQCPTRLLNEVVERLNCPDTDTLNDSENRFILSRSFTPSISRQQYLDSLQQIRQYIANGDCYQVNFARHFKAAFQGDTWQAYQKLRSVLPSPFSAYMAWDDKAIMSLSPERFIKLSMGQVETKPIKGTIPRGTSLEEDQRLAVKLQNSPKDRAENLMIVDLLRNDLGKSCEPGTIKVPKLFELESFKNVHHLVSTVTGSLKKECSPLELFQGCFPGGSITGAPKKRAMEIIDELEPESRSIYCGSIGYLSVTGRMDSNIAIRTLVADGNELHCWGGGGIVADSNPDSEFQESNTKIQLLMDVLEASG